MKNALGAILLLAGGLGVCETLEAPKGEVPAEWRGSRPS